MIHDLDIVLAFVDLPVEHVDAAGVACSASRRTLPTRLRFANGCVANLTVTGQSGADAKDSCVQRGDEHIVLDYREQKGYYIASPVGANRNRPFSRNYSQPRRAPSSASLACARGARAGTDRAGGTAQGGTRELCPLREKKTGTGSHRGIGSAGDRARVGDHPPDSGTVRLACRAAKGFSRESCRPRPRRRC